jgi:anti-sigma regulatory factor (Ser/Thr protein kinase)
VARGNLVIGAGPGWFSRLLRRLGTFVVMAAGLVAAGAAGGWLANARIAGAVEKTLRDSAASLGTTLRAGVEYELRREGHAPGLTAADADRLEQLALPEGARAWLTQRDGRPVKAGAAGAEADGCVHGHDVRAHYTRVHPAAQVPRLGLDPEAEVICSVAPVDGAAGDVVGMVVVHRPMTEMPVAAILARDLGILTGALVAIAVGFVLFGIQFLSGWVRRLQAAADRHERNEATANAAGAVLVRLAPHLAYEAEMDERVVDLMQTVDVISGRSGSGMLRPLDLALLLGECLDRRAPDFAARDRELRRELQPDVWVQGEPVRLALAVDHAVRNAVDALGDQPGRVEVTMVASRHTVEITVRDTGAEVPRQNRHRLFDTGYTTKEGRAGLGLALIRRVAVDHGGHVELHHPWGGGTKLQLVLPRIKKPKGGTIDPPPRPAPLMVPEDAPAEDPVMIMPPPPPVPATDVHEVPPEIAAEVREELGSIGSIGAEDLLTRSGAKIPSPPTVIRERTGAPKYLPGEGPEDEGAAADAPLELEAPPADPAPDFMDAETMVLDPEPSASPDESPADVPNDPGELSFEEAASEDAADAEPDGEPPAAESIEQQADDEMKDFFGV